MNHKNKHKSGLTRDLFVSSISLAARQSRLSTSISCKMPSYRHVQITKLVGRWNQAQSLIRWACSLDDWMAPVPDQES
jgi:hypothetical protein